jgi:hypothetical protein
MPECREPSHLQYGRHMTHELIGCTDWQELLWPEGSESPEGIVRAALAGKYTHFTHGRKFGAAARMKLLEKTFRDVQRAKAEDHTFENETRPLK